MAILYFVSLFGYALLLSGIFPKLRLGPALFTAFCGELFFSYTFVIVLEIYGPWAYTLVYGGFAALLIGLLLRLRRKSLLREIKEGLLWDSAAYFVLCAIFILLLGKGVLTYYDEYSFWARAAREIYVFEKNYINAETNLGNLDYIPMVASLQYCIVKVFGWSTQYLYYATIAAYTSVLSILSYFITNRKWKLVFCLLITGSLPIFSHTTTTASLSAELYLAIITFTAILNYAINRQNNSWVPFLPTICAIAILPGIKLISGFSFSIAIFFFILFSKNNFCNTHKGHSRIIWGSAIFLSLFLQLSWNGIYNFGSVRLEFEKRQAKAVYRHEEFSEIAPQFKAQYFFMGNPRSQKIANKKTTSLSVFLDNFNYAFDTIMTVPPNVINLTSFSCLLLVFLGIYILYYSINTNQLRFCLLSIAILSFIYLIGMTLALFVQPGTKTGVIRYLSVVFLMNFFLMSFFICYSPNKDFPPKKTFISVCVAILVLITKPKAWFNSFSANPSQIMLVEELAKPITEEVKKNLLFDQRFYIIENRKATNKLSATGTPIYNYYMLPSRGATYILPFHKPDQWRQLSKESLEQRIINNRTGMIYAMADDPEVCDVLSDTFGFEIVPGRTSIIYTEFQDGHLVYTLKTD